MIEFYSELDIRLKILVLICAVCLLVQLFYVLRNVAIVRYRLSKRVNITDEQPPVSVVIPTADDWDFVEKRLPENRQHILRYLNDCLCICLRTMPIMR